jgi:hypothetical protein
MLPAHAQSVGISSTFGKIGAYVNSSAVSSSSGMRNGLPAVSMDSFVYEAAEHAEHIYGDEGIDGPPPYECFEKLHRINTGILDQRDAGLTTGHGSYLPDAAGRDEFLGAPEFSMSGPQGVSWTDGFYDGVPFKLPGATYDPSQFPGGYKTLDYLTMYDEVRPRANPLPVDWNNGSMLSPVNGAYWTPIAGGSWTDQYGDVVYPDGSILYGTGNPAIAPGTYVARGS